MQFCQYKISKLQKTITGSDCPLLQYGIIAITSGEDSNGSLDVSNNSSFQSDDTVDDSDTDPTYDPDGPSTPRCFILQNPLIQHRPNISHYLVISHYLMTKQKTALNLDCIMQPRYNQDYTVYTQVFILMILFQIMMKLFRINK